MTLLEQEINTILYLFFKHSIEKPKRQKEYRSIIISLCLLSEETGGCCLLQDHTRKEALYTIPQNLLNQIGTSESIKTVTE